MDEYNTNQTYIDETQINNDGQKQKKKMDPKKKQRIISGIVTALVAIVAVIVVVINNFPKDKVFTKLEMKITLTDDFEEKDNYIETLTAYTDGEVVVIVDREDFASVAAAGLTSSSTAYQYLQKVSELSGSGNLVFTEGELHYLDWSAESSGTRYYYRAYGYKSGSAFWLIQFACKDNHKNDHISDMKKYAATVEFTDVINNA